MTWLLLLACLFIWFYRHNFKDVPGPLCLPMCGSVFTMWSFDSKMMTYPYRVMHRMSEVYGSVMRVMLGDQEWFVLTSLQEIKEFTMMELSTSHLPSVTFNDLYSFGEPLGVIFPDGHL